MFNISTYSWKQCFEEMRELSDSKVRKIILERVEERREQFLRTKREGKLAKPRPERLRYESMLRSYAPNTFGRRTICLSSLRHLRKRFISLYRDLCEQASEVLGQWRRGGWHLAFPTGLFPPCLPRRANLCPSKI